MALSLSMALLAGGCFGSHGPGGREDVRDAGGTPGDPDAGEEGPAPGPLPMPTPARPCGSEEAISIEVRALGTETCDVGTYIEAMLYDVGPLEDGLELDVNLCPGADADCRCAILVHGVSPAAHEEIARPPGAVTVHLGDGGVAIEVPHECAPAAEPTECVASVVFAAMDGLLESPPIDTEGLDVRWGESVCAGTVDPETDCSRTSYELLVTGWTSGFPGAIGYEQPVREGEVVLLDTNLVMFEAVRANAMSCPDARFARTAAWAAWAAH